MALFALLFLFIVRTATKAVRRHGKIMSLRAKKPNLLKGGKRDERKEYVYFCKTMNTRV